MRARCLIAVLFLTVATAHAQDVLTVGSGVAATGGSASVPVLIRDRSATPLGTDSGSGNRIQGFALKILFSDDVVASVTFARAGVTAGLTPLFETTLQGPGWMSYLVSFSASSNPIPFTLNAAAPGNLVGMLNVTIQPAAAEGSTTALTLHAGSAILSSQTGSVSETVANGGLSIVNGSVLVASFGPPPSLVATAASASQVNVSWNAVTDADHYDIFRSANGGASWVLADSTNATSTQDVAVSANASYLYRAQAVDGDGNPSGFSNIDVATTVIFSDDPAVATTTPINAVHVTQLRTAVNAMLASAALSPLGADLTIGVGLNARAQHVNDLRGGLAAARSALGLGALTFTDPVLSPSATIIKAVHIQELRNGVK